MGVCRGGLPEVVARYQIPSGERTEFRCVGPAPASDSPHLRNLPRLAHHLASPRKKRGSQASQRCGLSPSSATVTKQPSRPSSPYPHVSTSPGNRSRPSSTVWKAQFGAGGQAPMGRTGHACRGSRLASPQDRCGTPGPGRHDQIGSSLVPCNDPTPYPTRRHLRPLFEDEATRYGPLGLDL